MKVGAVLDASAMIAWLFNEPGKEKVSAALEYGCLISTVNWCEVIHKCNQRGVETDLLYNKLEKKQILNVALTIVTLTETLAKATAALFPLTKPYDLSLGDRACIALGQHKQTPILISDTIWGELDIGVDIQLIRQSP